MQFNFDTNLPPDVSQPATWILTRNALPELLSRYVARPASQITIEQGSFGRPTLAGGGRSIDFSTSHCDRLTAIAITPVGRIGIDIEREAPADWRSVALDCCTSDELEWVRSARDFLRLWTAKEACGKALGLGTNLDLRGTEMTSRPATSAGTINTKATIGGTGPLLLPLWGRSGGGIQGTTDPRGTLGFAGLPNTPSHPPPKGEEEDLGSLNEPLQIHRIQHSTALARGWQLFQRQHMDAIISVALVR